MELFDQTGFISSVTKIVFSVRLEGPTKGKDQRKQFQFHLPLLQVPLVLMYKTHEWWISQFSTTSSSAVFFFFSQNLWFFSESFVVLKWSQKGFSVSFPLSFSSSYSSKLLKSWPPAISLCFRNSFTWHGKWRRPWSPC